MSVRAQIFAVVLCGLSLGLPPPSHAQLRAVPFVSGLSLPVGFAQDPSNPSVQYVVEQAGLIRVIAGGVLQSTPFLDLRSLVALGGERGLLGLAFQPNYGLTGRFYVCYTRAGDGSADQVGDIVVARYRRSATNPLVADPATRRDLVWGSLPYIEHSGFGNHNGGHLAFGPDGYLYIAMGDGGGGSDPTNNAQNPGTLLGKILRINVSVSDSVPSGYEVAPGNPFLSGGPVAALPEIWAFGVRNPWKFSFDDFGGGTNALIMADVGQAAWEEVNYEPAGRGGRNYGWRNREGTHDHQESVFMPVPPAYLPLTDPIYEYDHSVGRSITGGFVYRGSAMSRVYTGRYFFADFIRGRVWSLGLNVSGTGEATAADVVEHTGELGGSATLGAISSFGRDAQGELYVVSYSGTIFRIVDVSAPPPVDAVLLDYNGDAFKDLLLYNRSTGDWTIQLGNAQGHFTDGPRGGWAPGWHIFVADFNGDSRDDVFLYSPATGIWFKVINTASGFSYFTQTWRTGFTVFLVDLDGDGISDVFLYDAATGVWFTCVSAGPGLAGFHYGTGGWLPGFQIRPADFDGDGRTDFLLYHPASGVFFKAVTRGNGVFVYSSGGWASGWLPFAADLNGDGRDDVFLYSPSSGIWYRATSLGDGTGAFSYVMGGWLPGWTVQPADFDGSGRTDFFLYHASGVWYKVINTGMAFAYFTGGWTQWSTQVADLDGDGHDDVFLYDLRSGVYFKAVTTSPGAFTYSTGLLPR